jgi:hypothetical protein
MQLSAILRRARAAFNLADRQFSLRERFSGRDTSRRPSRLDLLTLEDRIVPGSGPLSLPTIYAGSGAGSAPYVNAYDVDSGKMSFQIQPYESDFTGGVQVATADFNFDSVPDVVTGPGPGGGPRVQVFDGASGAQLTSAIGSFYAYDPSFTGGVDVAAADVNGDGYPDIITAPGAGGGPNVRVFSGKDGSMLASFYALSPDFTGGIHIAAADFTRNGHADIVVGAGEGGGPRVEVFDLTSGTATLVPWQIANFFAYDPNYRGGVWVGAGDVNGDTIPDIITGPGSNHSPDVKVFNGRDDTAISDFPAFGPGMTAGVRVAAAYLRHSGYADVVAATGPGVTSEVRSFAAGSGQQITAETGDFTPFGAGDAGGAYVGAGNDPGSLTVTVTIPTMAPSNPVPGQQFTLTSTITPDTGTTTPTGTVSFSATPAGGGSPIPLGTVSVVPATSPSASATLLVTGVVLPPGNYSLRADYSGDSTNATGSGWGPFSYSSIASPGAGTPPAGPTGRGPLGAASGAGGAGTTGATGPRDSSGGVRASDGRGPLDRTDLTGDGFGTPWGVTWSWSNESGYANGLAGSGSAITPLPRVVEANGTDSLAVVGSATDAEFFDAVSGSYAGRYGDTSTFTHDTTHGEYILADATGTVITFYDFSSGTPSGRAGAMVSVADPGGNLTQVTSWDSSGRATEIQRTGGSGSAMVTESYVYDFIASGTNAGLIDSVTQRRKVGSGSWSTVRSVAYSFYDGTQTYGLAGDLMLATVKDPSGTAIDTSYYRCYTSSGKGSTGYLHGLKYAFGPAAYARLTGAFGTGVDSLTDSQVSGYADLYQEYDSSQRVTKRVAAGAGDSAATGGLGTYTYAYSTNTTVGGTNSWLYKTVETLPDSNTNTYYSNAFGEVMLKVYTDTTTSQTWETFTKYDDLGRVELTAAPSAVTGYNDTYADLLNNTGGNYYFLSDSAGLIRTTTYATATTATTTTAGDAAGFVKQFAIQQGETGTSIPQEADTYIQRTASAATIYVPAAQTVYRNDNGTGGETTTTSYTWQGTTALPASETVTQPVVTSGENGPGGSTGTSTTTVFDSFGRAEWVKDAGGFLTYTQTDPATGAVVKQIADVNTAATGDFADLPSGWTTPTGGGLELISAFQVDALGRATRTTSPGGNVTYVVYNDPQHETLTYPGWNSSTNTPTGPTQVTRDDRADGYTEAFTMSATPHLTGGVPDGTETVGGLQALTRQYVNSAGQVTGVDDYFNLGGLSYSTGAMGTAGTNYYQTTIGYDADGRQSRVAEPTGTITRTVMDGRGRTVSVWVGTDDTPGSGTWSPTNNTSPANMTDVADYQYDGGGTGDGNLTQSTEHPGGGAADRVTNYWSDWRDRRVAEKDGVESTETDGVNRPLIVTTYDNLNEVTQAQQYAGDGVTPSISGGVLSLPSGTAADLRAQTITSFDELGRVYQTQQYDVNPSSGSVSSSALTTNCHWAL